MSMYRPSAPPPFVAEQTVIIATYSQYEAAQGAVDTLSDRGFDVARSAIVWNGLKRVEYVVGRQTVATAALRGALAAAWFALFIGLLVALFVEPDSGGEAVGIITAYVLVGAAIGAVWFGVAHWQTRGRRDFAAVGGLEAESYDVRVPTEQRDEAERILGITRTRSMDPPPAATDVSPPPT